MDKRIQEINYLKDKGYTSKEINDIFIEAGREPLTSKERGGLPKTKGWEAVGEAARRNLKEIPAGLKTMAGLAIRGLGEAATLGRDEPWKQTTPEYERALKEQSKAGEYVREIATDPRNLINIPLGLYGISTGRIGASIEKAMGKDVSGKRTLSLDDILYNISENPVYFGMDIAPIAKPIRTAVGKTNVAKRVNELGEFNRLLNTARVINTPTATESASHARMARQFNALPLEEQIKVSEALQKTGARDLGSAKSNKVLKDMRVASKMAARNLQRMGLLDKNLHDKNMIATYIGNNLNWTTPQGKPLNHSVIMEMLEKPEALTGKYKQLYEAGQSHVKKGNIAFVTQSLNPANVNLLGTPVTDAGSWLSTERIIGTRTPEEMVKVLPAAIKKQAMYAGNLQELRSLVDMLKDYKTGSKAKTYINIKDIDSYMKEAVKKGKTYRQIINQLPTIDKPTANQLARGEVIGLPEMELNALRRFGNYAAPSDFTNIFKRSVLGGPKWFIENRIGNLINNLIEGVTPRSGVQALRNPSLAPEQLDKLTRAYGFAQNRPSGVWSAVKEGAERTAQGAEALKIALKEKDLSRGLQGLGDLIAGPADIISNPAFSLEAYADKTERLANLIQQVKRQAKSSGRSEKAVWEQIRRNPKEFDKLYKQVNKSLGDYTTRNYYIPTAIEKLRSDIFPFYKFYTNTMGTTARQLIDKPLATQSLLTGPSKAGNAIRQDLINRGIIEDTAIEGGYPTGEYNPRGQTELVSSEGVPLTALAKLASSFANISAGGPEEAINIVSPMLGMKDTLALKNAFGNTLTSPKWEELNGVLYALDKAGYPTGEPYRMSPLEYSLLMAGQIGKQIYSPLARSRDVRRFTEGAIRPLLTGEQSMLYPMYDVQLNPLAEGDISRMPAIGALETLGPLAGIRVRPDVDYTKEPTLRGLKQLAKKRAKRRGGND